MGDTEHAQVFPSNSRKRPLNSAYTVTEAQCPALRMQKNHTSALGSLQLVGKEDLDTSNHATRRRQWHPTPVLLPGKSHGRRTWWATVHGVTKSWTQQRATFTFTFTPCSAGTAEKAMATHSSTLAWRIPRMAEPDGLPSMGSHRVRHD